MPAGKTATRLGDSILGVTLAPDQDEPKIIQTKHLRHVEPYWIIVQLPLGKRYNKLIKGAAAKVVKAQKPTIREALQALKDEGRPMNPTADWWLSEVAAGRVTLHHNDVTTSTDSNHAFSSCSSLSAKYHFHEQSVPKNPSPELLFSNANHVVVNKPAGIDALSNPAAGRVLNSLPGLLYSTTNNIKPAHRLDTPVSGVVCCGKANKDVKRLVRRIELGETSKTYLARIMSHPQNKKLLQLPLEITAPLGFDTRTCRALVDYTTRGKEATTIVEKCLAILKDGTAIVVIRIITGRKHQIRRHLQFAGMPIANDVRYGGKAELEQKWLAFEKELELVELMNASFVHGCEYCAFALSILKGEKQGPSVSGGIWLHSWKYEFPTLGLKFEAKPPDWACETEWDAERAY